MKMKAHYDFSLSLDSQIVLLHALKTEMNAITKDIDFLESRSDCDDIVSGLRDDLSRISSIYSYMRNRVDYQPCDSDVLC